MCFSFWWDFSTWGVSGADNLWINLLTAHIPLFPLPTSYFWKCTERTPLVGIHHCAAHKAVEFCSTVGGGVSTVLVGILSFMNSASRQRTSQGAWIFRKPTSAILPWNNTQQKQRGPLHFCSCTIAPMACAVQQLRQNPKTFETFALFVSDDHCSKREQILQCVWRMGIRLVSSSWRACYVRLSSCPTLVITASPHTKSDPVCTNATLRSVFKSTGSQTFYS